MVQQGGPEQRLYPEHLNRTAIQLEAQQRMLDQQQEFLDKQQRLLAAVQQSDPSKMTSLQLQELQQSQLMQQMHQQQQMLTQQQLELPPLETTRILSGQDWTRSAETSEQVGTSEDAPQPPQVFGSGTIKQIVYDSLCAASKNDNPVMFVNSQGGQITILNNTSKGNLGTGVPGTVVTIDGKRHFFPSDSIPSKPAAPSDLGDSSVNRAAEAARAQEDEGLSHHSRDASQNGAGQHAEGDPLVSALSCSVSDVQGSQGSHRRNQRPETSHSQHQGEHEPGNSMAEATSRANGTHLEGGLHAEAPRGTATYTAAVPRHRSPSPIPIGQRLPSSPLLATSQPLGDGLEQAGQAPAMSDHNSEGTNSWQGYANTGKLFQAAQGGALLNPAPFQGGLQDPSSNSGGPTLVRHPSQSLLQSIPSRPGTPVAILSADGTVTVTVNGLMSQAIPVVTLGAQSAQLLQPSSSAALSHMLHCQQQQQQQVQHIVQQPQLVQSMQSGQMQNQQPQVFHNQNLNPASAGMQYVQLVQGNSYPVASMQQPNMQGLTAVSQALPAAAPLSAQPSFAGGNVGAAVPNQMGQVGGGQEVLYMQAQVGQMQQQQPTIQQSSQLHTQGSLAFADSMASGFQTPQQQVPALLQPTPMLQSASSIPAFYQQVQANSGPQGLALSGQLSSIIQPQLSTATQLQQVPTSQVQPAVSYQYSQEMQRLLSNQHQLVAARPQPGQGAWPAPTSNPLTSDTLVQKLEQLQQSRAQVPQGTFYQDPTAQLAPAVQYLPRADSLRDASQTAVTTAYGQSGSEEVHSRSGASTQMLSQGARDSEMGSQGTTLLGQLQQAQHPGRSPLGNVPPSQSTAPENEQSAGSQPPKQGLPPGTFAFVPPTPPFHGTPTTVLPALPRNLQAQTNPSMLRTVSSSVSAAGSLHDGLSRANSSGQASVNQQRTAGVARTGSGLRVNYVHDEADALAAAAHVAVNNGMKLPDFGLEQTRGDALVEKLFNERREESHEDKTEGTLHSNVRASGDSMAVTALKTAAKLAEAASSGGTNGEPQAPKLHRAKTFPGCEAVPNLGGGQHAAFLNAFSNSEVTVSPPLKPPTERPPLRSEPEAPPPLPLQKGSFREAVDISVAAVPLQSPQAEDAFFSPNGATAQALSFLNDEPDPNFQPQAVKPDSTAEKLQREENQPSPCSTLEPSQGKRKAEEAVVARSNDPAPAVYHSREISLVDGFFLDAIADEQEGKKARKASPQAGQADCQLEATPHAWQHGFSPN